MAQQPFTDTNPAAGIWLLVLAVAVVGSNSLVMGPIAPGIANDLVTRVETVLLASAGYGFGTAVGAVLLAPWIDRLGQVTMLRCAFFVFAVVFVCSALAPSTGLLIFAQSIAGLAAGVALPAVYSLSATWAPKGQESRVLGRVLTGWTLSLVAGVSVSALLADAVSWRSVYAVLAAVALVLLILFCRMPESAKRVAVTPSPIAALTISGVPQLLTLVCLYMLSFYGTYSYVGDHMVIALGRSLAGNAWLSASYGLGFGAAALVGGSIDRIGATRATPWLLAALAALYLGLSLASNRYGLLIMMSFVWGLLNHLSLNGLLAQLSAVDLSRRGTILGLYSAVTYLCMGVATLGFGVLYPLAGWAILALLAALLCITSAVLSLRSLNAISGA